MDWRDCPRCDQTASWPLLQAHFNRHFRGPAAFDLRRAFADDPQRAPRWGIEAAGLFADLSKNLIDDEARRLLTALAAECGVATLRDAMLAGAPINTSEQRAATHTAWRLESDRPEALVHAQRGAIKNKANESHPEAAVLNEVLAFAEAVRADATIRDVVNLGIGGSDLGPRMVVQALRATHQVQGPRVHHVANMDGHELAALLPQLQAQHTLFIVASKSFTTAETMQNAASARAWFQAQGGGEVARHFVAVSANRAAAEAFGAGRCFAFDEGVGGRYSLWSPVGLSIAIAAGASAFRALLGGARAMDRHFAEAPLSHNLPLQLALLDVWYRNFHGFGSRCVAPYHHGLRRLPAYLQQLEMESNGKRVDRRGRALPFHSAPVTWGEVGSNGQHAFFQMLHQGSDVVPVEFLLVRDATHSLPGHHARLQANALAQARALMLGQAGDAPERDFPGNRPSTTLLLPDLSPHSLGALLALYEHRTFSLGALWGLNPFDQWGVELGKRQAGWIEARLKGSADSSAEDPLDASTEALIARLSTNSAPGC